MTKKIISGLERRPRIPPGIIVYISDKVSAVLRMARGKVVKASEEEWEEYERYCRSTWTKEAYGELIDQQHLVELEEVTDALKSRFSERFRTRHWFHGSYLEIAPDLEQIEGAIKDG